MGLPAIRTTISTVAASASGGGFSFGAGRAKLGYTQYAPANTILSGMLSAGPYAIVCEGEKLGDENGEARNPSPKRYRVQVNVWVAMAREADNDFVNIETFIEAICTALRASASLNVVDTSFGRPEISTDRNPAIAKYELLIELVSC